jgi:hypothetical protein
VTPTVNPDFEEKRRYYEVYIWGSFQVFSPHWLERISDR